MKKVKEKSKIISKLIIIVIAVGLVVLALKMAPDYLRDDITDMTNLIINNNNVTSKLQKEGNEVYIDEKGTIYLSIDDMKNFFDKHIYQDKTYNTIITTSDTKIAQIGIEKKELYINSSKVSTNSGVIKKDDKFYIPISELTKVYNIEIKHIENTNIVIIDSLDRSLTTMSSSKNNSVKYKAKTFSRTVDKIGKGESVNYISETNDGWVKIRTKNGIIGYVKKDSLTNETKIREEMVAKKQIEGKVSLVWDYFSEYASAPTRTEKIEGINVVSPTFYTLTKLGEGKLDENIGSAGQAYINWAHTNGYKVWAMVSNNSYMETTSTIMNDYKLREKLINNIVNTAVKNGLDGINIDFENMYSKDKNLYSRFIIELAPRLKECGIVLSVDVTAPDGSDTWSLCFDRNTIADVADYIMFMAYDQHGDSSKEAGTVAGHDWTEVNIKKFLGQEGVSKDKIILGMPFYTRTWWKENGKAKSTTVAMKNVNTVVPVGTQKTWNDDVKQNYVKYTKNGREYEMWIEDIDSIKAKLSLIDTYELVGACYWQYGQEDKEVWSIISESLNIK